MHRRSLDFVALVKELGNWENDFAVELRMVVSHGSMSVLAAAVERTI